MDPITPRVERLLRTRLVGSPNRSGPGRLALLDPPSSGLLLIDSGALVSASAVPRFSTLHRFAWHSWLEDIPTPFESLHFLPEDVLPRVRYADLRLREHWDACLDDRVAEDHPPLLAFLPVRQDLPEVYVPFVSARTRSAQALVLPPLAARTLSERWSLDFSLHPILLPYESVDTPSVLEAALVLWEDVRFDPGRLPAILGAARLC